MQLNKNKKKNGAQKTASSQSVKTILDETFSGSPVNACSVEPESSCARTFFGQGGLEIERSFKLKTFF